MYNKKGFVLLETIIVLVIVVSSMIGLFLTYSFVLKDLKQARHYDNLNDVYKLNIFYGMINSSVTSNNIGYLKIDGNNCASYLKDENCSNLLQRTDLEYLLYTDKSIDLILSSLSFNNGLKNSDVDYIKTLDKKYTYLIGTYSKDNEYFYVSLKVGEIN